MHYGSCNPCGLRVIGNENCVPSCGGHVRRVRLHLEYPINLCRADIDLLRCCPPKIIKPLQNLGSVVKVEKVPSLSDPTIRVSYNPNPPKFTIRHIVKSIQAIDPQWRLSVAHPPSLEERAQRMQVREQRRLLIRIMLALTIAIPTFIL